MPFFFMVSGYFAYGKPKEKFRGSIRHIAELIMIAYAINLMRIYVQHAFSVEQSLRYLRETVLTFRHILMWIVLNTTLVSGVAWFLFALLYCYITAYFFQKQLQGRGRYCAAAIGFGLGICSKLVLPAAGLNGISINNAWMCGLPYFLSGMILHQHQDKLEPVADRALILFVLTGAVLKTIAYVMPISLDYVGDIFLVIGLFALALKHPQLENSLFSRLGSECAFYIYIMHPVFMHLFDAAYQGNSEVIGGIVRPIVVIMVTVGSALAWTESKKRFEKLVYRRRENAAKGENRLD